MLDEYLALGGVEIGNNARAYAYSRCLSCCAGLLKCPGCEGIHDATNPWAPAQFEWLDQETNLATNPSFETTSGTVEVYRNLATNPSFEATTAATVEVRRNIFTDPRATATTGWGFANGGSSAISDFPGDIATAIRHTATNSAASRISRNTPFLASTGYVVRVRVRTSVPVSNFAVRFRPVNSTSGSGEAVGPLVDLPAGVTEYIATVTTGATAWESAGGIAFNWMAVSGETLDITGVLVEKSPVLGTYFDGSTVAAGDFSYAWTGTANASESVQYGIQVPAVVGALAAGVLSSEWAASGSKSVRIVPTSTPQSRVEVFGDAWLRANLKVSTTYTILATARLTQAQVGTLDQDARAIFIHLNGTSIANGTSTPRAVAPNAAGVHPLRLTFTTPASLAAFNSIRLMNGASQGNGDVWWDDLLLVEGTYTGPYFDGSNPGKIRRNLAPRTQAEVLKAQGADGGSVPVATNIGLNTARKVTGTGTWHVVHSATSWGVGAADAIVLQPGQTARFSALAWSDEQAFLGLARWKQSDSSFIGDLILTTAAVLGMAGPGTWLTGTHTAGSNVEKIVFGVRSNSTVAGGVILATAFMVEIDGTVGSEATWFDGSSTPDPGFGYAWEGTANASPSYLYDADLTPAWTGTANASASALRGVGVVTYTSQGPQSRALGSTQWASAGNRSVRVIPIGTNDTFVQVSGMGLGVLLPGHTYTLTAKVRLTAPLAGTLFSFSRRMRASYTTPTGEVGISSAQPPNIAGEHEVRVTWTVPANATAINYFRLYNGASAGNGDVWWDDLLIVEGEYDGPYFDGDTLPAGLDPVKSRVMWTGDPHASSSVLSFYELIQAAASEEPPYDCATISRAPWYDEDSEVSSRFAGFYLLSVQGATDGTMTAGTTEGIEDGGVIGASRHAMRSVRVRSMLVGCGNDAAEYGLAWLKAALGEKFCGRHGGACGTSDLAFFIDCPPPLHTESQDYDIHVDPYRRYLHGVACTSAPIISSEYETPSGAYVIIVDYILTAESPFVWGESERVGSGSTVLTAYDDIPFNLMRYPSAETADGVPRVVATNYAMNGSVEYGTTGWVAAVLTAPAGIAAAGAQSTDIAAVGPHSFRGTYTATATLADVSPYLRYDVSLAGMPAGARPSVSVWGRVNPSAGSPVIDRFRLQVEFWNAAKLSVIEVADFDPGQYDGQNLLATGLEVPAGATQARILLIATTDVVNGDALRIYGDAFALTVP